MQGKLHFLNCNGALKAFFHDLPGTRSTSYLDSAESVYIPQSSGAGSKTDGRLTCLLEKFNLYFVSVFCATSCTARERVGDIRVVM